MKARVRFSELASRLTGISTPVFGISYNPPESEVVVAKRVIAFLEDRRVLYNDYMLEVPAHCVESIIEIRHFLTQELGNLDPHADLARNLQAMRAACRRFLDVEQSADARHAFLHDPTRYRWSLGSWEFLSALGHLRATIGLHVALIAIRNGLDVESDLASILPAELEDER